MTLKGKTAIREYHYRSSSDAGITYTTLLYSDGTASCNCPGWTRRVAKDGSRTCKHIIASGIAPVSVAERIQDGMAKTKAAGKVIETGQMKVIRRFRFDKFG